MQLTRPSPDGPDPRVSAGPLAFVVEQLWRRPLDTGDARVKVGSGPAGTGWVDVERYRVVPTIGRARMLFPAAPREATVGTLLNFRGLRRRLPNAQRNLLGSLARSGHLPFPTVRLQTRVGRPAPATPLATVARALHRHDIAASFAVNFSANRKATLHVVDSQGLPLGFAKFAWDPVSTSSIRAEEAALRAVGEREMSARAPKLLASGQYYGSPFIITSPLPVDSVGVRNGVPPPEARELYSLLPLVRRDRVSATGQYADLRERLRLLADAPADHAIAQVVAVAERVLDQVAQQDVILPVQERCHGDLAAWNTARSSDGTLWLFDWESSEADAVAGLDALHWHMSALIEAGRPWNGAALLEAINLARPLLTAAGGSRVGEPGMAGLYAATIAERAGTLATGAGGWEKGWVLPEHLLDMLAATSRLLTR